MVREIDFDEIVRQRIDYTIDFDNSVVIKGKVGSVLVYFTPRFGGEITESGLIEIIPGSQPRTPKIAS